MILHRSDHGGEAESFAFKFYMQSGACPCTDGSKPTVWSDYSVTAIALTDLNVDKPDFGVTISWGCHRVWASLSENVLKL
jgi:hypothetical protein